MADWDTRATCLARIVQRHGLMREMRIDLSGHLASLYGVYSGCSDPVAVSAFGYAFQCFQDIVFALRYYLDHDTDYDPPHIIPYFLANYTIAEAGDAEPITWKDIIKAWGAASDPGKMWTITELDWMRKQLWHKPTNIKWEENPFED